MQNCKAQFNNTPSKVTPADWLNDWGALETHVLVPWVETALPPLWIKVVCCSAVMRLNLWGLMEALAYPLVSPHSGCFVPVSQSHTAAQHMDVAWTSCHKHVSLILGLMRASLEDHRRNASPCFTAAWTLALVVIWTNVCKGSMSICKEGHTCFLHTHFTFSPPPHLSVSGACMVASWWVQLEFHTQLGSSSNGDWHVPENPLHTAATVDVYILDQFCISWVDGDKWIFGDLCVALSKTLTGYLSN